MTAAWLKHASSRSALMPGMQISKPRHFKDVNLVTLFFLLFFNVK
jgi:hypothetical protein